MFTLSPSHSLLADDVYLPSTTASCSAASPLALHRVPTCSIHVGKYSESLTRILFRTVNTVSDKSGFIHLGRDQGVRNNVYALAMEVAKEAQIPGRSDQTRSPDLPPWSANDREDLLSIPLPPRNNADDVSLHNPLLRLHRMGCGWLGVILEWDGVIVEDDSNLEREAWMALAQEEGRRPLPFFVLRKVEGMKREQALSEVFCWTRDHREIRRLAQRAEEIFQGLQGGIYRLKPGSREFVLTLKKYQVSFALATTKPRRIVEKAMEAVGLEAEFSVIVSAEDVYRGKPDPEMYMHAAQLLGVIPERCIVIGNSNSSIEAAHDTFMKCIAVAGKHPIYELGAADLVITTFDNLSFVDLKNLADLDSPEFRPPEPLPELEEEEPLPQTRVGVLDN